MNRVLKAAFAALVLVGAGLAPAWANDRVKITVSGLVTGFANYFVAIDRGYFARQGIDVDVIQAGGNVGTPALLSGDVFFSTSASIGLTAILKGGDLRIVYVDNDHQPYELWTANPAVKTIADLKGRQVGIETRGDTHELTIRSALQASGIDPATVFFTPLGNRAAITAGLLSGSLGGASMILDEVQSLKSMPNARMLYDLRTVHLVSRGGVFAASTLAQHRDLAKRFMRAEIEGARRAAAFPEDVVAAVLKRNPAMTRQKVLAAIAEDTPVDFPDGTIPLDLQKQEIANRADYLAIPPGARPAPAQVFDFTLLREVNAELDKEGWKP